MKRILVATPLYPPEQGGPATYSKLIEAELPSHGYSVTIVPFSKFRSWPKGISHILYLFKLVFLARKHDILMSLDPVSVGLPVLCASYLTGAPYILRVPGDYAWEQGQSRFGVTEALDEFLENIEGQPKSVKLLASIEKKVAASAARIIVPSHYMKTVVSKWGVNPEKITPIYSAFVPITVKGTRSELRKKLNVHGTKMISIGRLVPWKGFEMLISAMPILIEKVPDLSLTIIGSGPDQEKIENIISKLNLNQKVTILPAMSREKMGEYLLAADLFVLNTSYEGMSHQLLEAMELGVPVVTTSVGGNPELIKDSITGMLFPFNDKEKLVESVVYVLNSEKFRESLISNARLRVKDFEHHSAVDELVVVVDSVN